MQSSIEELIELGPLPNSVDPDVVTLEKIQTLVMKIEQPISDDEARALIKLFGPDDCFGLAWTLLHIIEAAPGWPLEDVLDDVGSEWIDRLKKRSNA